MATKQDHPLMVTYQFEADDELWERWKNTVPRSKSLDERIVELLEADAEGRVEPASGGGAAANEPSDAAEELGDESTDDTEEDDHADSDEELHEPDAAGTDEGAEELPGQVDAVDTEAESKHAEGSDELPGGETGETGEGDGELPEQGLDAVEFPGGVDAEKARAAVFHAHDYIRDHGGATKKEIVTAVMPEYPLGYDVDAALAKIEGGQRYRGAWWRKVVKPGLEALDDVEKPSAGRSEWRHTGE